MTRPTGVGAYTRLGSAAPGDSANADWRSTNYTADSVKLGAIFWSKARKADAASDSDEFADLSSAKLPGPTTRP